MNRTWVPRWLHAALTYSLPSNTAVSIARIAAIIVGGWLVYFALSNRWRIGADRRAIYLLVGVIAVLQEGQQLADNAPFLVWRLPLFLALDAACLSSVRHYVSGAYNGQRRPPNS